METPDFGKIERILAEKAQKFQLFAALLAEYNEKFNLTAVTDPREVKIKHFADSLAGEGAFPRGAHVAEVGSGGGFPSVPLMIAREDLDFTLIESTGKKCDFLRAAVKALGLNAEVLCARAEDAGRDPAFRERFTAVCARAVARLDTLAEYCLPLVRVGGRMIAYKGSDGELFLARGALCKLGGDGGREISYELPSGMGARTLVLIEKKRATPPAYPRGRGKERSAPLS